MKTFVLVDAFDGRAVHSIRHVSARPLARKAAAKFMRSWHEQTSLIEVVFKADGSVSRNHVQTYKGTP